MVQTPATAPLTRNAMAYVLAGGRGSRLMELTDWHRWHDQPRSPSRSWPYLLALAECRPP
jgi:hypothetical protein